MKKLASASVISVKPLSPACILLTVETGDTAGIAAGQFASISIPGVYLRRPFSVHDADGAVLSFLVKLAGKGTRALAGLRPADKISIIYPLGRGFQLSAKPAVLVGGGAGMAPLLLLAKQLQNRGIRPTVVLGGRTGSDIVRLAEFARYAEIKITTEDGSLGVQGLVTGELKALSADTAVYACGPEPMLKALHGLAQIKKFSLQLSLEALMGCGLGACLCCVTDTRTDGRVCVCTEGPVFRAEDLPW
ncbi:MAG: dihydroorotate dehydrogenase electron transfer subunit [Candidatus Margulisbacteria bacterium]|jgi:dihydroorotate dehydrogenase electron transfer subunit|nr:dihydroorotate dehydrogenase electron transfer subunit [Candidatus Margulisiibacteriota bacterium]